MDTSFDKQKTASNLELISIPSTYLIFQLCLYKPRLFESGTSKLKEKIIRLSNGILIPDNEEKYPNLKWLLSLSPKEFIDALFDFDEKYQNLISINEHDHYQLISNLISLNGYHEPRSIMLHIQTSGHGMDCEGNAKQDLVYILETQEGFEIINL